MSYSPVNLFQIQIRSQLVAVLVTVVLFLIFSAVKLFPNSALSYLVGAHVGLILVMPYFYRKHFEGFSKALSAHTPIGEFILDTHKKAFYLQYLLRWIFTVWFGFFGSLALFMATKISTENTLLPVVVSCGGVVLLLLSMVWGYIYQYAATPKVTLK